MTSSLSGNAIPIDDKAWNFIVLEAGQGVNVSLSYELFENASECRELRVENLNLTSLDSFPVLPNLETLCVSTIAPSRCTILTLTHCTGFISIESCPMFCCGRYRTG